jgi:hypothetical protein
MPIMVKTFQAPNVIGELYSTLDLMDTIRALFSFFYDPYLWAQ